MVPCMAYHPIRKLEEAVGDFTPSGQNIEENETTLELGIVLFSSMQSYFESGGLGSCGQ